MLWYECPQCSVQRAFTNYPQKLCFPKVVHRKHCPTKYFTSSHKFLYRYIVVLKLKMFQIKIRSILFKGFNKLFKILAKKKIVTQTLSTQNPAWAFALHHYLPHSSMLWFGMFKIKIHIILLKQIFHTDHCTSKCFTRDHLFSVCCALVCSN